MTDYLYKARDPAGKMVRGSMEAITREELASKLHNMGYLATEVREDVSAPDLDAWLRKFDSIGGEELLMFYVELAGMVGSGMTLLSGLQTLREQASKGKLKEVLGDLVRGVESGDLFSSVLARHPKVFPPIFTGMARVGEATGKLDAILLSYAKFSENEEELRQKIKNALTYPTLLLVAGVAAVLFIVTFIIPQFSEIFLKAGVKLPVLTVFLYNAGTWLRHSWLFLFGGSFLIWTCVVLFFGTPRGRLLLDGWKLGFPVAGDLNRKAAISRFSRTLGILVQSGVPILHALDIAAGVVDNKILSGAIANARQAVERGESIAGPLKVSGQFPPDVIRMIGVGEDSGTLDEMLAKLADFYDMGIGYAVKRVTVYLESLFLLVMGVMVAFIMASLLLPIFDMTKILRR